MLLDIADDSISKIFNQALELDSDGVTRFATFSRLGEYWVFADDQGTDLDDLKKVTILAQEQIISIQEAEE